MDGRIKPNNQTTKLLHLAPCTNNTTIHTAATVHTYNTMSSLLQRLLNNETQELTKDDEEEPFESSGTSITEVVLAVGLFILMVGVGASCKVELLRKMFRSPKALKAAAVGVTCQFGLMPLVAYLFTLIFNLKGYTALGFILAGSMPGGSSSNVYTMWSKGVLELSVFMTILSTLLAFGMTPLLIYVYSQAIDGVDPNDFPFQDIAITFAFLIIPLSLGMALNFLPCKQAIKCLVERLVNGLAIVIFIAAIVVVLLENPNALKKYGSWEIYVSAIFYFPVTTGIAYIITGCLKFRPSIRRTVVMETGFQNLVLAFTIAERTVETQEQMDRGLPFPVLYAAMMFVFAAILVPVFRRQKRYNEQNGIVDYDPDFILKDEESDETDKDKEEKGIQESEEVAEEVAVSVETPEIEEAPESATQITGDP